LILLGACTQEISVSTTQDPDIHLDPISASPTQITLTDHTTHIAFSDNLMFDEGKVIAEAASVPAVLVIGNDIYVYFVNAYTAHQPGEKNIYYIVSKDGGKTWTQREPIEINGLPGKLQPVDPSLLEIKDGEYRLYFYDLETGDPNKRDVYNIYSATSSDGINFEMEDGIRISLTTNMTDPSVIHYNNEWFMYYGGGEVNGTSVAISDDGLNFVDYGSVQDNERPGVDGTFMGIPGAMVEDNLIYLYNCEYLASSTDGIHFDILNEVRNDEVIPAMSGCDPSPAKYLDGYIMVSKDFYYLRQEEEAQG